MPAPDYSAGKTCTKCGETKPRSEFWRRGKNGLQSPCKDCQIQQHRSYRERNRETYLRQQRERAKERYREVGGRDSILLRKYGITEADLQRRLVEQEGRCPICRETLEEANLHVDHCHKTGTVRGLLHFKCNAGLGMLGDDPDRADRAARYLRGGAP